VHIRARREAAFRYASWREVVGTLANEAPANVADLQALVVRHLRDLADQIRHGPTDAWKAFWNTDKFGRPSTPQIENYGRDRLLDMLRPKLLPHGVAAEREGSFAEQNRADIKIIYRDLVLPVEIKRHYHAQVWTAPSGQLQALYGRDPATEGRGVYLVLWFGPGDGRRTPPHPGGLVSPTNAADMQRDLQDMLPIEVQAIIQIIVID
jgi:hypothetical protein